MNDNPKIGLITTFYEKSKNFHKDCFSSIINQTDKNFELMIFGDDYDFCINDLNKISCHYQKVSGLTPRQIKAKGIRKAFDLGVDYICFIDSDDMMIYNRIEEIRKFINKHSPFIVVHNLDIIDFQGKSIAKNFFEFEKNTYEHYDFYFKNNSGFGNTVYRTDLLLQILPFPEFSLSLDWEIIDILSRKFEIKILNKSLTKYRQHQNNCFGLFNSFDQDRLMHQIKITDCHFDAIIKYYKNINDVKNLEISKKIKSRWERQKAIILSQSDIYIRKLNSSSNKLNWHEIPV